MNIRRCLNLSLIPLLLLGLPGCTDEDTDKSITTERFNLKRELLNYSATDEYTWNTSNTEVVVTIQVKDFREGDFTVRIFDASGKRIFDAGFNTNDRAYFIDESFYFQRLSGNGRPGDWKVVLGYNDFTGDYEITLE